MVMIEDGKKKVRLTTEPEALEVLCRHIANNTDWKVSLPYEREKKLAIDVVSDWDASRVETYLKLNFKGATVAVEDVDEDGS